jgi:hypothetical protein
MEVGVQISGNVRLPGTESTFTQDVSSCGARVITTRRWSLDDHLRIASLPGGFESTARVAYCQPLRGQGYAIGLQFLDQAGRWVVPSADE